jgi:hypothetical protein
MNTKLIIEKPVMEFFEEADHLRIEANEGGIKTVRYIPKEEAMIVLKYIGMKSTVHRGQLVTI